MPDWEALRDGRCGDQGTDHGPAATSSSSSSERSVTARGGSRALGPRRRTRPTGSSPTWSGRPAPTEVVKVKSMATQEIGLNEALDEAGIAAVEDRPRRADRPARRTTSRRTSWSRRSTATAPRSATSSSREMADVTGGSHRRAAPARDGRPGTPAAQVPHRHGRGLRRELRRRRDRHPGRGRVRGQRSDVPDPAADPDHRHGHREAATHLRRPRGVPAAAAPLVHRRTDEPLHLDCGPGSPPATGRRSSTWSCWTTGAPPCWPTRSDGRPCTASGAAPA